MASSLSKLAIAALVTFGLCIAAFAIGFTGVFVRTELTDVPFIAFMGLAAMSILLAVGSLARKRSSEPFWPAMVVIGGSFCLLFFVAIRASTIAAP